MTIYLQDTVTIPMQTRLLTQVPNHSKGINWFMLFACRASQIIKYNGNHLSIHTRMKLEHFQICQDTAVDSLNLIIISKIVLFSPGICTKTM